MPTEEQYYVTPARVLNTLGIPVDEVDETTPYYDLLVEAIIEAMDWIDSMTCTTWKGRRKQIFEKHSLDYTMGFSYVGSIFVGTGYYFPTSKYPITKIDSIVYPYGSSSPSEFITDPEDFGSRDSQTYYVDTRMGEVNIRKWLIHRGGGEIGITYTYGRDNCPKYIENFTKWKACEIMMGIDTGQGLVPDQRNIKDSGLASTIQTQLEQYTARYRQWKQTNAFVDEDNITELIVE